MAHLYIGNRLFALTIRCCLCLSSILRYRLSLARHSLDGLFVVYAIPFLSSFTFHLFLSLPVCLCSLDITIQSFSSLSFSIPIVFNKWKQNRWLLTILNANEKDNGAEKLIFVSFAIHFHSTSFHSIGIALRANQPKTVTLSSYSSINNKKIQSCHCSFYFSARFEPH